ncbi:MAG: alpha/beta hydrolase domain-containing protein [Acidimicrobiales bacterium]
MAAALRRPPVDPLGGLEPQQIIAAGESQSGARLATYINAVHPLA